MYLVREKVVHTKKEEGENKVRHDEKKKFIYKTISSDSLYCVNSSLTVL